MAKALFTNKQQALLARFKRGELSRVNILQGSVRSGKTYVSLVLWALFVATSPKDAGYLMAGKTITSLKRNALDLLQAQVGKRYFTYSASTKQAELFGRRVYLEGVSDARAEGKIRGMTLCGAYCDEISLFTEDFFTMLLSRLSQPGAKLIGTTNPDHPSHWLRLRYLQRRQALSMLVEDFFLEDNTFLDPAYIEALKKEYTGVFYDRFILGKWVAAEGRIYDMFDAQKHVRRDPGPFSRYYMAVDYGTANPCTFGLYGVRGAHRHLLREYYYDSRVHSRQKTDLEYAKDLLAFAEDVEIDVIYVDPSAASFIAQLEAMGLPVQHARNDVMEGIRTVCGELAALRFTMDPSCKDSIREYGGYVWDERAADNGVDKPLKAADHCCDRDRYALYTDIYESVEVLDKNVLGVR